MKIAFVHIDYGADAGENGGSIFDHRLMSALEHFETVDLHRVPILRVRKKGLPIWRTKIAVADRARLMELRADGARIVLSHEALFSALETLPGDGMADMIIVHNFIPRFRFTGRPVLSGLYRAGSGPYFRHHLQQANSVFWLSNADFRHAASTNSGGWQDRSFILAPPPRQQIIGRREPNLIHVDGTSGWWAKRMSKLSGEDVNTIHTRGYMTGDFGATPKRAFGLITDQFSVGYKLKLMQMIYCRDVIASLTDLEEDVRQVAPEYPCYRTVGSVREALDYFDSLQGFIPENLLDKSVSHLDDYTWETAASELIFALEKMQG